MRYSSSITIPISLSPKGTHNNHVASYYPTTCGHYYIMNTKGNSTSHHILPPCPNKVGSSGFKPRKVITLGSSCIAFKEFSFLVSTI